MIIDPDVLRARILASLKTREMDQTDLARQVGRGPDYVRDFLKGRKGSMRLTDLKKMEQVLQTAPGFLTSEFQSSDLHLMIGNTSVLKGIDGQDEIERAPYQWTGVVNAVRLYAPQNYNARIMKVGRMHYDTVAAPWFLMNFPDCYGLLIFDESMAPVYEPGDLAIVNPYLPLIKGKDYIFRTQVKENEYRAIVRRLVTWDEDTWDLSQVDPNSTKKLPRSEWVRADRIVAKHMQ